MRACELIGARQVLHKYGPFVLYAIYSISLARRPQTLGPDARLGEVCVCALLMCVTCVDNTSAACATAASYVSIARHITDSSVSASSSRRCCR
jgi:hypothetical protein